MDLAEKARGVAWPVLKALDSNMLRVAAPGAREAIGDLVALVTEMAHEIEILKVRANVSAEVDIGILGIMGKTNGR